jgi:transcription elongation factor Elf1
MVDYVDLKFATSLNSRLERFQIKNRNPYKINFRCHICGDSQSSKSKARGWLLEDKHQSFHYYCHNCGSSLSFHNFLKGIDASLYREYISEKYLDKTREKIVENPFQSQKTSNTVVKKISGFNHFLKDIKRIGQLAQDHPVRQYLDSRMIPAKEHPRIYYAPKFMGWVNSMLPNKFEKITKDEPRVILPFLDENGAFFGLSARGFSKKSPRYITIMLKEDSPKIFGLDKVNFSKPYMVLEGAIDSLFLDNAVAMAGADGNTNGLKNLENAIFVFDGERRNKEIHKRMEKIISKGLKICIWSENVKGKDVNEMIMNGEEDVASIINKNTYSGLCASLRFAQWKLS